MGLFDFAAGNKNFDKLLLMSLGFGLLFSLIVVSINWYRLKKKGLKSTMKEYIKVVQKREIKSSLDKAAFIQKLEEDSYYKKAKIVDVEDGVQIRTHMNFFTWGEAIDVKIEPISEVENVYKMISRPKLSTTLIDYGRGYENVNRLEKLLR